MELKYSKVELPERVRAYPPALLLDAEVACNEVLTFGWLELPLAV